MIGRAQKLLAEGQKQYNASHEISDAAELLTKFRYESCEQMNAVQAKIDEMKVIKKKDAAAALAAEMEAAAAAAAAPPEGAEGSGEATAGAEGSGTAGADAASKEATPPAT